MDQLPVIDISGEADRHVVIARGTGEVYQGHPTTVLMPDRHTIFCTWSIDHGGACCPMAKSLDGGLTWATVVTPGDWPDTRNCPSMYLLEAPDGQQRLMVFAAQPDMPFSYSEDEGRSWSPMASLGFPCVMAFSSVVRLKNGDHLGMYHRREDDREGGRLKIWQSVSTDGGLTWGEPSLSGEVPELFPCEPGVIRSPDGEQLLCLVRENTRVGHSLKMTSDDEGATWSKLTPTSWGLSGDRHMPRYSEDGRLVVVFRDRAPESSTRGHFVAWVGTYEDAVLGRPGQYRIKLLHSHAGSDCGYPGLELLPDGNLVATTYVKYRPGPEKHSVVSVRFKLSDTDAMV